MSTYVVTGGAGFIGSNLCESLMSLGHDIVIIDNLDSLLYSGSVKVTNVEEIRSTARKLGRKLSLVIADIRDQHAYDFVFEKNNIEGVFHLAALAGVRPSIDNPSLYFDVNCTGTTRLLEVMHKFNVKNMVFASSSSVYGNSTDVPFSEQQSVDRPISPYAASKKAGELICHTFSNLHNMNIICLRFFTVYGPRQRPDLAIHKFVNLMHEEKEIPFYGNGETSRDYTYVTDVCDGIIKSMSYARDCKFDVLNIGESSPVSLKDLVVMIAKNMDVNPKINRLPMQPGDVNTTWADVSKAQKMINYSPRVTKEEGIKKFVEWFRAKK